MSNLLDLVCGSTWAIRPETLEAIVAIANREEITTHAIAAAFHFDPSKQREAARAYDTQIPMRAVGTRQATPVDGTRGLYRSGWCRSQHVPEGRRLRSDVGRQNILVAASSGATGKWESPAIADRASVIADSSQTEPQGAEQRAG